MQRKSKYLLSILFASIIILIGNYNTALATTEYNTSETHLKEIQPFAIPWITIRENTPMFRSATLFMDQRIANFPAGWFLVEYGPAIRDGYSGVLMRRMHCTWTGLVGWMNANDLFPTQWPLYVY